MEEKKTPESSEKKNIKEAVVGFFKKLSKKQLIAIISAVVAVAILVPVIILIPKGNSNKKPPNQGSTPNGSVTTPEELDYELPEKVDMGGYIYRAYVRSNAVIEGADTKVEGNPAFYCEDFWVDSNQAGQIENDALSFGVYTRNSQIETDYHVQIRQVSQTINQVEELARFYQNGEKFDLTIILAISAASAATQNLLVDLKGLPGLELTHETYDQNSIRELSMGGKLYYLSGDMNISTMDSIAPTVVNIDRYESFAAGIVEAFDNDPLYANVYNLVTEGKWTIANMLKIAEIATTDADSTDGDLGASDMDNVGYCQYATSTLYYFYGAGGRLTQMTEEGSPEFVIGSSKNQNLFDYIFQNLNKTSRDIKYPYGWSTVRKKNFIDSANTLFTDMALWDVRKDLYQKRPFAYGVLPTPVYEEGDSYNSLVYFFNTVHLWAIPSLTNDLEKAQIMMNVMSAYSNIKKEDSTMHGYYTKTLYFTVSPDPNARRVMDIIKNTQVYDIAILYDWGGMATELQKLGEKTTNPHATLVTNLPNDAIPKLEETIELFKNPLWTPEE